MSDLIEIQEAGEPRRLGLLEQPIGSLKVAWKVQAGPDGTPTPIPKSQWIDTDLSVGVREIQDQDGVGMCASAATVNAVEVARSIAGLPYVPLSAGDLYRRVAGGRDQGSLPEDNLLELLSNGIAPLTDCPYLEWRREMPSASRQKFRGVEAWLCPTAAHVFTAVQLGFPVLIGYWHSSNDPVDADGWMTRPSGRRGGHAVLVVGTTSRSGEYGGKIENTWGVQFGKSGYAVLPESRVEEGCRAFQAWSLRAVVDEGGAMPPPVGG